MAQVENVAPKFQNTKGARKNKKPSLTRIFHTLPGLAASNALTPCFSSLKQGVNEKSIQ